MYALYFSAQEKSHQSEILQFVSSEGKILKGGWWWSTSHSLDQRLIWDGKNFVCLALGDHYPNAFHFKRANTKKNTGYEIFSFSPKKRNNGELGGIAKGKNGNAVIVSTPHGRKSWDILFLYVDYNGKNKAKKWLTNTKKIDEKTAKIAPLGDNYLVAWKAHNKKLDRTENKCAIVNRMGEIIKGPEIINANFYKGDDFVNFPNGDVGWAHGLNDPTKLKIIRFKKN